MRKVVKRFVSLAAESLSLQGPIYEFGALQVEGQQEWANLRPLFPGQEYVGCDMRAGHGVDRILDLHALDLPDRSVATVICVDTLEHVEHPERAAAEIHRVLADDGVAIIASVMNFPIHCHPFDYWRFTPEAFRSLLKPFAGAFVGHAGLTEFPHTVAGIGFKGAVPDLARLEKNYLAWQRSARFTRENFVRNWLPPALVPGSRRIATAISPRR